ncbi:MAG: hypothetical protein J0H01_06525 [Rhizobiales bacterium]|nr:hypothetical protein [Hyphomicrobiales bacterium]
MSPTPANPTPAADPPAEPKPEPSVEPPPAGLVARIVRTMRGAGGALAGGSAFVLALWVALSASGLLTRDVVSTPVTVQGLSEGLVYALPRRDATVSLVWELTTCELQEPTQSDSPPRIGLTLTAALDTTLVGDPGATYRFASPRHWLPLSELALQVEYIPGTPILKTLRFNAIDRSGQVIAAARGLVHNLGVTGASQAVVEPSTPVSGGGPAIPAHVAACAQWRIDVIKRLASLRANLAGAGLDEAAASGARFEIARLAELVSVRRRIPLDWDRETAVRLSLPEVKRFFESDALGAQIVAVDDLTKLIEDSTAVIAGAASGPAPAVRGSATPPDPRGARLNGIVYRLAAERDLIVCRVSCARIADGSVPNLLYQAAISVPQLGSLGVIPVQSELLSSQGIELCFAADGTLSKVAMTSRPPGSGQPAATSGGDTPSLPARFCPP